LSDSFLLKQWLLDISAPSENQKPLVYIASPKVGNTIATAWHRWEKGVLVFREESIRTSNRQAAKAITHFVFLHRFGLLRVDFGGSRPMASVQSTAFGY